jgi:hypothetical protein
LAFPLQFNGNHHYVNDTHAFKRVNISSNVRKQSPWPVEFGLYYPATIKSSLHAAMKKYSLTLFYIMPHKQSCRSGCIEAIQLAL